MATVRAFLSEVCLSIQAVSLLAGGGFETRERICFSLLSQKMYAKSSGSFRIGPSSTSRFLSNPDLCTNDRAILADFASVDIGKST